MPSKIKITSGGTKNVPIYYISQIKKGKIKLLIQIHIPICYLNVLLKVYLV